MDTDLYSMGAFFCDQHPELVDEVVARAGEIEPTGLSCLGRRQRRSTSRRRSGCCSPASRSATTRPSRADRDAEPLDTAHPPRACRDRADRRHRLDLGRREEGELDQITGTGEVQELIGGIRQLGDRLGDADAPVTLTLFKDVQCPRCADFQAEVIDPLIEDDVRTGEVRSISKNFPLGLKPVTLGAIAVEAAAEQDRGWQYAELFMRNLDRGPRGRASTRNILDEVASVTPKLDTAAWEEAIAGPRPRRARPGGRRPGDRAALPADPIRRRERLTGASETLEDVPTLEDVEAAIERVS